MGLEPTVQRLTGMFKERIAELQEEPEFQWSKERTQYATENDGAPGIRLAVGNVSLDYDLWHGLRNPAVVGLYPAGLKEIWEFYANRRKASVDEGGRKTIFQIPRSFDYARKNYRRAVIVSVMLPFSPVVMERYVKSIEGKKEGSSHLQKRMYKDVNLMLDKATGRIGIALVDGENAVVAMDNTTVAAVSKEAIPQTRQGAAHGTAKGGNYPQKSLAVLMGLGQFGLGRFVIRDELVNGQAERFVGPLRSIILFDREEPVKDGRGGVIYPTEAWREFLFRLTDFTNINQTLNAYRFCSYIPHDDNKGCGKCVASCHRGALANSVPHTKGGYPERVAKQEYRFWEGELQFDCARCGEDQQQMASLFPEWSCARCVSTCASEGSRQASAAASFYQEQRALTKEL